jgi:hypothetical protein
MEACRVTQVADNLRIFPHLPVTVSDMEEVPRDQWVGPRRLDPVLLDKIMIPGGKWFRLEPGVDFSTAKPFHNIRDRLYRAAAARGGGRCAVYQEDNGSIMIYATGCRF